LTTRRRRTAVIPGQEAPEVWSRQSFHLLWGLGECWTLSRTASRYAVAFLFDFLMSGLAVAVGPSPALTLRPFLSVLGARDLESASERNLRRPGILSGKIRLCGCCWFLYVRCGDVAVLWKYVAARSGGSQPATLRANPLDAPAPTPAAQRRSGVACPQKDQR